MALIIEGIYYFIKITIGFEILELLFERKPGRKKWILFITELIAGAFHIVNTAITMHTFSNNELVLFILFTALIAVYFYTERMIKVIGIIWFYYVAEQLLELFLITLCYAGNIINRKIQLIILCILLVIVYETVKKIIERYDKIYLNLIVLFFLDIAGSILIIFFQRVYLEPITNYILNAWKVFASYTIFLISVFAFYEYGKRESEKYKIIKEKNKMLEQNYHYIFTLYKENARLLHDFNAHISVIRKYLQENEIVKGISYINELIKPSEELHQYIWTNCEIIDLIINLKKQEAGRKGISIEIESDIFKVIEIPDTDLCAIFSNLIDNAIENVIPNGEAIRIYIKKRNELLIFIIRNPITKNTLSNDAGLFTTKKDKWHHGIGLDSVKYSINKNSGSFEYSIQDSWFEVIVTLPI